MINKYFCMKLAIFYSRLFQNSYKNVSIVMHEISHFLFKIISKFIQKRINRKCLKKKFSRELPHSKLAIFYSRLFQNSYKNVSIVNVFKKIFHDNYPIALPQAIFYSRLFQNSYKNVSIVNVF